MAAASREGGNTDVTVVAFPSTNHLFQADPDGRAWRYKRLPSYRMHEDVLGTPADWLGEPLRRGS